MSTIIVVAIIVVAVILVIRHKMKDFRAGKYCSCGCEGCSASCGKKSSQKN